jgi:hypothetical protein
MQKVIIFICHIISNSEQGMYKKLLYVQTYTIIYMQAEQKQLHKKR